MFGLHLLSTNFNHIDDFVKYTKLFYKSDSPIKISIDTEKCCTTIFNSLEFYLLFSAMYNIK